MGNNLIPDGSRREVTGTDGCLFRLDADGFLTTIVGDIGVQTPLRGALRERASTPLIRSRTTCEFTPSISEKAALANRALS
jgi:hypothetical protein